jgi:hypothetical protein
VPARQRCCSVVGGCRVGRRRRKSASTRLSGYQGRQWERRWRGWLPAVVEDLEMMDFNKSTCGGGVQHVAGGSSGPSVT